MPTKITYYAIVNDYSNRDEPGGVLRRVEGENAEYDEQFGRDLAWTRSPLLYSYERGNLDNQLLRDHRGRGGPDRGADPSIGYRASLSNVCKRLGIWRSTKSGDEDSGRGQSFWRRP